MKLIFFLCEKCKHQLNLWEIFKLGSGPSTLKEYKCKCGASNYFKDNIFLRVLPALYAAIGYPFLKKTLTIFYIIAFLLLLLYFINIKPLDLAKKNIRDKE